MNQPLHVAIQLKPIGIVEEGDSETKRKGLAPNDSRFDVVSKVRVFDEYPEGLRGLEEYSHAFIIYYMQEVAEAKIQLESPQTEALGVFATRSPYRPNLIGLTVVEIVSVGPPLLKVRCLDAWTGTPVLDIKPYGYYDVVKKPSGTEMV